MRALIAGAFGALVAAAAFTVACAPRGGPSGSGTPTPVVKGPITGEAHGRFDGRDRMARIALAAGVAALAGAPVHVLTANGYLAGRDAADFSGYYRGLGLSVAAVDETGVEPRPRVLAGLLHDPVADGHDRPRLLGEMEELGRLEQPALGVLPARQRLSTHDVALRIYLGLEMNRKPILIQCSSQSGLQHQAFARRAE